MQFDRLRRRDFISLLGELRGMYENRNPLQEVHDYARSVIGPKELPSAPLIGSLDLEQVTGPR
jgi:hypothetical protein